MAENLGVLIKHLVDGSCKKVVATTFVDGREFEVNAYVVPTQARPVFRIDLSEVVEKKGGNHAPIPTKNR